MPTMTTAVAARLSQAKAAGATAPVASSGSVQAKKMHSTRHRTTRCARSLSSWSSSTRRAAWGATPAPADRSRRTVTAAAAAEEVPLGVQIEEALLAAFPAGYGTGHAIPPPPHTKTLSIAENPLKANDTTHSDTHVCPCARVSATRRQLVARNANGVSNWLTLNAHRLEG